MNGSASGGRRVSIEAHRIMLDDHACDRCGESVSSALTVARQLEMELAAYNIVVDYVEIAVEPSAHAQSNRVFVNGRPVEEWVGGETIWTTCPSCTDIFGEVACCAAIRVGDAMYDSVPPDMIRRAALEALGMA